jgi:hypothetical protein
MSSELNVSMREPIIMWSGLEPVSVTHKLISIQALIMGQQTGHLWSSIEP